MVALRMPSTESTVAPSKAVLQQVDRRQGRAGRAADPQHRSGALREAAQFATVADERALRDHDGVETVRQGGAEIGEAGSARAIVAGTGLDEHLSTARRDEVRSRTARLQRVEPVGLETFGIGEAGLRAADRHEANIRTVEPAIAVAPRQEQKGGGAADAAKTRDRDLQHVHWLIPSRLNFAASGSSSPASCRASCRGCRRCRSRTPGARRRASSRCGRRCDR